MSENAKTIYDYSKGTVAPEDAVISPKDQFRSTGKAGVLLRPTVFPFFFRVSIANGVSSHVNFPEMLNLSMRKFTLESDGEVTLGGNLYRLMANSAKLLLNGNFVMEVPQGYIYPIDFVPDIEYSNASGSTRQLVFYGWLTNLPRG